MTTRMIRSLECILLGLLTLAVIMIEAAGRPHLPDRPYSLSLLLPTGLIALGAMLWPIDHLPDQAGTRAAWRLQLAGLACFGLTPFFVWHFPFYQRLYFMVCGFLFLLCLIFFLVSMARLMEICFARRGQFVWARVCRWAGISVSPLMGAIAVIVYLHALGLEGLTFVRELSSPYTVWLRVSPLFRNLFSLPFAALTIMALFLTVIPPPDGETKGEPD